MQETNDALKLIANANDLIKGHLKFLDEHEISDSFDLEKAVKLLDEAVDKLACST